MSIFVLIESVKLKTYENINPKTSLCNNLSFIHQNFKNIIKIRYIKRLLKKKECRSVSI